MPSSRPGTDPGGTGDACRPPASRSVDAWLTRLQRGSYWSRGGAVEVALLLVMLAEGAIFLLSLARVNGLRHLLPQFVSDLTLALLFIGCGLCGFCGLLLWMRRPQLGRPLRMLAMFACFFVWSWLADAGLIVRDSEYPYIPLYFMMVAAAGRVLLFIAADPA